MKKPTDDIEKLSYTTHGLTVVTSIFLIGIFVWAALSPLDIVSQARGTIIPASKVQEIQHLEGGIIQEIKVHEGDEVEMGQPLLILSSINNASDMGEIELRIASLKADIHRLESEASNLEQLDFDETFTKQHTKLVLQANELFLARLANLESSLEAQKQEIESKKQELEETRTRLKSSKQRLSFIKEQIEIGKKLLANNLSNRYEQIERLKEANTLQSHIDEDSILIKRHYAAIEKAQNQLQQIQLQNQQDIQAELSETKRNLDEFIKRADKYRDSLERTIIRAPVKGIVKRVNIVTEGGVVRPGVTIMELVPGEDKLVVEAQLMPQDVGYVYVGQRAFVQLEGPDAFRLGKIMGVVSHVSPDSLVTEEGQAYFVVKIILDKKSFGDEQEKIDLFPGMVVNVGIILNQRTVLEYIFSPFLASMPFIFSEK
ncbi:HlyD family type I secretion periplasmic adaptor subunit [Thiomicrorhabdus immobilis]|uniref:Membrane fusion protein (MFP) family protein n=1 Tax=Thiomicrorhabdus immobilis TaxID=2791037 RepID=A0ABM7MFE1_9GAMM|nr:HlyD family type I secretion periplasmic adaptor subunit [Thiomicrorhabdus immobilis]BCN94144.1 HlyD family type I secretion periplasmic adaptor subunit [Thiomicrorhabdus immobilis]